MQIKVSGRESSFRKTAISTRMFLIVTLALTVGGCAMTETQERTATGAALGAAAGALIDGRSGAAWGAAIGAGGGYLYDQQMKRERAEAENQRLREENWRLRQQR